MMKLLIRLSILSGLIFLLFSSTDQVFDILYTNNAFAESTASLVYVASITGFLLFILFTYVVEYAELRHLIYYHKHLSKWINVSYVMVSLVALGLTVVSFDFRKSILVAMTYLIITIAYDYLRERIMLTKDMSRSHPKTII